MSKVLVQTNWYQEVSPRSFYLEDDLERAVMVNLKRIFPKFQPFLFKVPLWNPKAKRNNKADLAMVNDDYSEWYVIEVELGKHSLPDVIEQIETFKECVYDDTHADYILNNNPGKFDQTRLRSLMKKSPSLMVIVNEVKDKWKSPLNKLNCKICVFQVYNDYSGERLFRIDGEHPYIYTNFCNCKYEKSVPFAIKVLKSDFLDAYGINNGDQIRIDYNGKSHLWTREDSGKQVFLISEEKYISPLDEMSSRYRLNYRVAQAKLTVQQPKWWQFWKATTTTPTSTNLFSFTKD